ncbi:hypothetical protein [Maioricimonas rarisocia]|uniref:hypothetical protein n=1 Tax=Maioricimonas rarisocia TaxID=2528026 RepID=UPI0011A44430|nr:hypothetical protein [Maioricimonas rarisocia]
MVVPFVRADTVEQPETEGAAVLGLTERTLQLPDSVPADATVWRGVIALRYARTLRNESWQHRQNRREQELRSALATAAAEDRKELRARLDVLNHARETFQDPGVVIDAVLVEGADAGRLLVDANRNGRLDDDPEWTSVLSELPELRFRGELPSVEGPVMLAVQMHKPESPPAPVAAEKIDPPDSTADRSERIAYLHALDGIHNRKQHLPRVIAAADAVIETIGEEVWTRSPEELSSRQQEVRQQLIDALYRKGRALAYMELPDVIARHPIIDQEEHDRRFEANFQQLARLVDTTERKFFLLHIRRDRRRGDHGQAIRLLNRYLAESPDVWLFHKKRRDLYGLLGWNDWQAYEHAWMLIRFPEQHLK